MLRIAFLVFAGLLAVFYYHLVGAAPDPSEMFDDLEWWRPRGWLQRWELLAGLVDLAESRGAARLVPVVLLWLPPLALALGALALFRSVALRIAVLWLALTLGAFAYYGLLADRVWNFFEWRFPAVVASVAAVVAVVAFAPSLLRALARAPVAAALLVLAGFAAVFLLSTEITGTDPMLPFNLSPWPALTVVGFSIGGYALAALHLASGIGLWIWDRVGGAAGAAAGCATAALAAAGAGPLLLSDPAPLLLGAAAALGAAYAAAVGATGGERRPAALSRVAAGALVGLAIYGSNQAAHQFQSTARNQTAQAVLVALEAFKSEHATYPDRLAELVPEFLDAVPRPRIGLIRDEDDVFRYSNFGDSYALEFASVEWVQCAYSPPYQFAEYDEYDEDEDWDAAAEDEEELDAWERYDVGAGARDDPVDEDLTRSLREAGLEGSWSCAEKPPKIW